jgi:hypothetical protein
MRVLIVTLFATVLLGQQKKGSYPKSVTALEAL